MDLKTALVLGYQTARSAHYAGQQFTLPILERLATGRQAPEVADAHEKRKQAVQEIGLLLRRDSENISQGLYPLEVLRPEWPAAHWLRFGRILWDGMKISKRRAERDAHDLSEVAQRELDDVPEYYRRNFHYQSGGYLTDQSADLYEHQVEILFAGAADAMRRLILPLMKKKWPGDGEGLHFLETAAGTGRLSRFVKLAYPRARLTVTDLSWPYLQSAQKKLSDLDRLEFVRAAAEELPFRDGMFDAVFSCYLFHELPEKVRHEVVAEGRRVLKPGGLYGFVDSLQNEDTKDFSWALDRFPVDFHEPFYRNYVQKPMEGLLVDEGFGPPQTTIGFLSKAVVAAKPGV